MLFQYQESPIPNGYFRLRVNEHQGEIKIRYYLDKECVFNQNFDQIEFPPDYRIPIDSIGKKFTVVLEDKSESKQKSWIIGDVD